MVRLGLFLYLSRYVIMWKKRTYKSVFVHFTNQHKPPAVLFSLLFSFGIIKPLDEGGNKHQHR